MKKKELIYSLLLVSVIVFIFHWIFISPDRNEIFYNKEICRIKKMQIVGEICACGGHGKYQWLQLCNMDYGLMIRIESVKYKRGYWTGDLYDVGDSLFKKAGSRELTIKRDTCEAVYILGCDELLLRDTEETSDE